MTRPKAWLRIVFHLGGKDASLSRSRWPSRAFAIPLSEAWWGMDVAHGTSIAVVIATRNRGNRIARTVGTILSNDYPDYEVVVVDQSDDDQTQASLQLHRADPRLRYLRSAAKGVSAGRNLAISTARGELIAITDDDCDVATDWLQQLSAAFRSDARIGIVFGNVLADTHDRATGFIPSYVRHEPFTARGIRDKHRVEGISACMGIRKDTWQALGGFDQMLGAGAPFKSAAETDLTIRAVLAGFSVYETPRVVVTHYGFRTWAQGKPLIRGYLFGIGAMMAKHLKCGHWSVLHVVLHLAWRWAFQRPAVDLGDRLHRGVRLKAFLHGFACGAKTAVDRTTGQYIPEHESPVTART
jgi:glycosyltransferase involved in cell wall biosynthesis